jgi:hypothetical protein
MHLRNLGILGLLLLIAAGKCTAQVRGDDYHGHGYPTLLPAASLPQGTRYQQSGSVSGAKPACKGLAAGAESAGRPTDGFVLAWAWRPSRRVSLRARTSGGSFRSLPRATRAHLPTKAPRTSPTMARVSKYGSECWHSALRVATISTPAVRLHGVASLACDRLPVILTTYTRPGSSFPDRPRLHHLDLKPWPLMPRPAHTRTSDRSFRSPSSPSPTGPSHGSRLSNRQRSRWETSLSTTARPNRGRRFPGFQYLEQ